MTQSRIVNGYRANAQGCGAWMWLFFIASALTWWLWHWIVGVVFLSLGLIAMIGSAILSVRQMRADKWNHTAAEQQALEDALQHDLHD
jgi:hypothetical protein